MITNYRAMTAPELMQALESVGRAPDVELIRACIERHSELIEPWLDMLAAPPDKKWEQDDPRRYAPIHAGHVLIHFCLTLLNHGL